MKEKTRPMKRLQNKWRREHTTVCKTGEVLLQGEEARPTYQRETTGLSFREFLRQEADAGNLLAARCLEKKREIRRAERRMRKASVAAPEKTSCYTNCRGGFPYCREVGREICPPRIRSLGSRWHIQGIYR